ncbi:MAG: hypothetical protein WAK31_17660 [Chthoniobacterales bacterium]
MKQLTCPSPWIHYREWCIPSELINLLGQVELPEGEAELGTGQ